MTIKVKTYPALSASTGRIKIRPPIIPLTIPTTVRGELKVIIVNIKNRMKSYC
jgi:hypothetical protein